MEENRRTILKAGAAAATVAAAPQVFAQQAGQGTTKFFEKGAVRIAYQEAGSGFPLLCIAGGGLFSLDTVAFGKSGRGKLQQRS